MFHLEVLAPVFFIIYLSVGICVSFMRKKLVDDNCIIDVHKRATIGSINEALRKTENAAFAKRIKRLRIVHIIDLFFFYLFCICVVAMLIIQNNR